ncbi:MAG: phosphatidate cytidylyltransferase [Bacteroidales bacterium]|nr:phosphatidate cytidylyltransferase [Bacteroidales bacterium]MBR5071984.1 phosphatidate cytidylyltransferase [Bacteroidales bacterium]
MNNFTVRTVSGIGFVLIMLAGLLVDKFLFAALVLFIMTVMMKEFYRMTIGEEYRTQQVLAIIAGCIMFVLVFLNCAFHVSGKFLSLTMVPIIILMISSLYAKDRADFKRLSHIYTGLIYIAAPLSLANLIAFQGGEFNALLLLCFFVIIWCSDIGAFAVGCTLGQKYGKKLWPEISPKKSWAGFWGGMAFAVLASLILRMTGLLQLPVIHGIILAVIMHVAGVYGDLFESQWKRASEVKDSGRIIPGHGGMLDRFDSAIFAVPAGAIYLSLLNLL